MQLLGFASFGIEKGNFLYFKITVIFVSITETTLRSFLSHVSSLTANVNLRMWKRKRKKKKGSYSNLQVSVLLGHNLQIYIWYTTSHRSRANGSIHASIILFTKKNFLALFHSTWGVLQHFNFFHPSAFSACFNIRAYSQISEGVSGSLLWTECCHLDSPSLVGCGCPHCFENWAGTFMHHVGPYIGKAQTFVQKRVE